MRDTFAWFRARGLAKMIVYNQGKDPAGANFPSASQAVRSGLASGRFSLAWPR